jgi:hypothetical protein
MSKEGRVEDLRRRREKLGRMWLMMFYAGRGERSSRSSWGL